MRGEILHYDDQQGFGFISGEDSNRYTFRREDMNPAFAAARGMAVEFHHSGTQAREVSPAADLPERHRAAGSSVPSVAPPAAMRPATAPAAPQRNFGRDPVGAKPSLATPSMGLWAYFWNCMTVNYATFSGRARRKEYWAFVLFGTLSLIALSLVGLMIDGLIGNFGPYGNGPIVSSVIAGIVILAGFLPGIAVTIRRFHDVGMSGWFYLLFMVLSLFSIGGIIIFVVSLIPTQKRENQWGPVPEGIPTPPVGQQ